MDIGISGASIKPISLFMVLTRDSPRGEAGEDPIGEAVRAVWDQTGDPTEFLRKMAWVTTLEGVEALLDS